MALWRAAFSLHRRARAAAARSHTEYCFCIVKAVDDFSMMIQVCGAGYLGLLEPGDLVGWSGLVRRDPCEWLTAATPLKLIGFPAEDFTPSSRNLSLLLDG